MNIELYFEITINGISKDLIIEKLDRIGYQYKPYSIKEYGKKDIEPDQFMCLSLIPEGDAFNQLVRRIQTLYQLDGINKVKILHTLKEDEKIKGDLTELDSSTSSKSNATGFMDRLRSFVDHWIFPVITSTSVYAITITGIVYRLKPGANTEDYILSVILPTSVSLLTYIGTRKSVEHAISKDQK